MRRRKKKLRKVRERILIMCEGETERNYFRAIKEDDEYGNFLSALDVEIVTAKYSAPKKVVKEAKRKNKLEKKKGNPYEITWIVFDHDHHLHRTKAYKEAIKNKFRIAFSAICFEMWYLLHFKKTARKFTNANNLIKELKKHYVDYEKAKQNDFENLKESLSIALTNAVWLRTQMEDEDVFVTDQLCWTDVDVLVQYLTKEENKQ